MIWIAIAIIVAGFLIVNSLKANKNKEIEERHKELELNPDYIKYKDLQKGKKTELAFRDLVMRR